MASALPNLWIEIGTDPSDDAEHLSRLAYRLRDELLDLDVDAVQIDADDAAPTNSKGTGLLAAAGLAVQFVGQEVLRSIIDTVVSWLVRQHRRSIKLTLDGDLLELTGVNSAEQDRLIELWVSRHVSAG